MRETATEQGSSVSTGVSSRESTAAGTKTQYLMQGHISCAGSATHDPRPSPEVRVDVPQLIGGLNDQGTLLASLEVVDALDVLAGELG